MPYGEPINTCQCSSLWLYLNNAAWEESVVRRSCLPCRGTDRSALALAPPSLALFGAKHASLLASGLLSLVWTANKRTFEAARGMMAIRTVGEKKERPVPVGENIYEVWEGRGRPACMMP